MNSSCGMLCTFYCVAYSRCSQPWRRTFQRFDERLQQRCAADEEEWKHHSGLRQDDTHQPHLSGDQCSVWWILIFSLISVIALVFELILFFAFIEWKRRGPDDQCLDRNGKLYTYMFILGVFSWKQSNVKPTEFLFSGMVWRQTQVGPTTSISFIW